MVKLPSSVVVAVTRSEITTVSSIPLDRPRYLLPGCQPGAKPVRDDSTVRHLRDKRLHLRVIDTHCRKSVERDVLDEFGESSFQRVEIAIVIEVFRIDICDHSDGRWQFRERAVGFVGLDHDPFAAAEPGVGAVRVDDAAIDDRWVNCPASRTEATMDVVVVLP